MKPWMAIPAVLLPLMIGCGVDRGSGEVRTQRMAVTQMEPVRETFALGTAVTASGAVAQQSAGDNFIRGGEVFLSVDVSGASSDQTVEVRWIGPEGLVIRRDERRATRGTRYIPFSSGGTTRWTRGPHRAVILIDGRAVSEKAFELL